MVVEEFTVLAYSYRQLKVVGSSVYGQRNRYGFRYPPLKEARIRGLDLSLLGCQLAIQMDVSTLMQLQRTMELYFAKV